MNLQRADIHPIMYVKRRRSDIMTSVNNHISCISVATRHITGLFKRSEEEDKRITLMLL